MPSDPLFGPIFTTPAIDEAVSGEAWVRAMLRVEGALAHAEAAAGLIPVTSAEAIARACESVPIDTAAIGRAAVVSMTPVVPLVAALRAALPPAARDDVHRGATSQDVLDTATMLIARDAIGVIDGSLQAAMAAAAGLAETHRETPMVGRTLLQQAAPITFGLKAAGWLLGLLEARQELLRWRRERPALQLGGAAGTLASLGPAASLVEEHVAAELGLRLPPMPWHTRRTPITSLAAALAAVAGAAAKVALDVVLLAQDEVAEVHEAATGASSAMPHKQNPSGSVRVLACARIVHSLVPVLGASMVQEHERAAGAWQAEWPALQDLFRASAAAADAIAGVLEHLVVRPDAMYRNLEAGGGLAYSELILALLARRIGVDSARRVIDQALAAVAAGRSAFREALAAAPELAAIPSDDLDALFEPANAFGSATRYVDNALAAYRHALVEPA